MPHHTTAAVIIIPKFKIKTNDQMSIWPYPISVYYSLIVNIRKWTKSPNSDPSKGVTTGNRSFLLVTGKSKMVNPRKFWNGVWVRTRDRDWDGTGCGPLRLFSKATGLLATLTHCPHQQCLSPEDLHPQWVIRPLLYHLLKYWAGTDMAG